MKKPAIILLLAFVFSQALFAQTDQEVRTIIQPSQVLNEEREIKVYLPKGYHSQQTYPVIYITDGGSSNFEVAKNYIDILTDPAFDVIPPSILVGIVHPEGARNKDLNAFRSESGSKFITHLIEEVVPMIDESYNTSGFNTMIGHSNGAEINHFLLLEDENPFRGFISISTNFNTDVKDEISDFLENYEDKNLYYFIANGTLDAPSRTQAGNDFEAMALASRNESVKFKKNTFQADHIDLVPFSLTDGLRHVFQDYGSIEAYPTIMSYSENYLEDLKENYGIEGHYDFSSIQPYYMDILMNKKVNEWKYLENLISEHKLWQNPNTREPSGLDPINVANAYYMMGQMPETIEQWNRGLKEFENVEELVFYSNLSKLLDAYKNENRLDEAVDFLEASIQKMSDKYTLFMTYKLAKLSLENNVSPDSGTMALNYCKENYRENRLFSMDDLESLGQL